MQLYSLCLRVRGGQSLSLARGCAGSQVRAISMAMCSASADKEEVEYAHAVATLNSLQTNAAALEEARKNDNRERRSKELRRMYEFLERVGLQAKDLDRLNAIHVTGTKGKGSVCAMCERILRAQGLTTGFYSSPHLREVRERIRLDGRPLPKAVFVENFWDIYNKLDSSKAQHNGSMPNYFRFLTVMAFNIFLKEKVDVAVVEVGIGGTFDSTNIIPNPVVCGITSLGYDHVDILGDTLEKIAWQKGGICKPGHPAFTLPQDPVPLRALEERAKDLKVASFEVVPELHDYPGEEPVLALAGKHQRSNASLAVQLCKSWLQSKGKWSWSSGSDSSPLEAKTLAPPTLHGVPVAPPFSLPPQFYKGLKECKWPGRNQVISEEGISYFIDGAHTPQSIESSVEWFKEAATKEAETMSGSVVRVLLFNTTGKRDADVFLRPLLSCEFDYAIFSPNITDVEGVNSADQTNMTVTKDNQCERPIINEMVWNELMEERTGYHGNGEIEDSRNLEHISKKTKQSDCTVDRVNGHMIGQVISTKQYDDPRTRVFMCLRHALQWCTLRGAIKPHPQLHPLPHKLMEAEHVQVLVTGSLHLAGAFMSVLNYSVE